MLGVRQKLLGFSLVELMAVLAVIAILVALAVPRFQTFIARSRQAEAMHNLGNIDALQKSFRLRKQGFGIDNSWHNGLNMGLGGSSGDCSDSGSGTKNDLGFRVDDCNKLRYTYATTGGATSTAKNDGHDGNLLIYPSCNNEADEWTIRHINAGAKLANGEDIVSKCDQ